MTRRGCIILAAVVVAMASFTVAPSASAQGLFDFLFGDATKPQQKSAPSSAANFFADPFGLNQQTNTAPPRPVATATGGRGGMFCVRTCDGKYFPLSVKSGATPARMCQAFCPAAQTRIYSGSTIDGAVASNGERYADSANAFAYRKALKADCTCNGRDPAGLAQVDLSQDPSLRSGDVVATADGLVAYTGVRLGSEQAPDFAPVADYPGLTAGVRAKLGEMKVAPASADMLNEAAAPAAPDNVQAARTPKTKRTVVN